MVPGLQGSSRAARGCGVSWSAQAGRTSGCYGATGAKGDKGDTGATGAVEATGPAGGLEDPQDLKALLSSMGLTGQ
ncbi:MAG: hypothetical protein IPO65_21050 [Saprospiraceae bacterium]|nr:hypothetical protein [Saprospiraceae bacterium]